ncbi:MAG: hypothetical protein PHX43_09315, partial [Alphaproteobacteria bacterium]|nr:hypothetical protein [Alphaproteobacteria bacterium]
YQPAQKKRMAGLFNGLLRHVDVALAFLASSEHIVLYKLRIGVPQEHEGLIIPVIQQMGFEPLSYGNDRMIARYLQGSSLKELAVLSDSNLVRNMYPDRSILRDNRKQVTLNM